MTDHKFFLDRFFCRCSHTISSHGLDLERGWDQRTNCRKCNCGESLRWFSRRIASRNSAGLEKALK